MIKYFLFFFVLFTIASCSTEKVNSSTDMKIYTQWIGKKIKRLKLPTTYSPKIFDSLGFTVYHYTYQMPNMYDGLIAHQYYYLYNISQFFFVDKKTSKIKEVKTTETNSTILCYKPVPYTKTVDGEIQKGVSLILDSIKNIQN